MFSALFFCHWSSSEEAKANAPCVIFIDELDSVGGKRIESPMHPYSRQTINQLLAEMDGYVLCERLHACCEGVFVSTYIAPITGFIS